MEGEEQAGGEAGEGRGRRRVREGRGKCERKGEGKGEVKGKGEGKGEQQGPDHGVARSPSPLSVAFRSRVPEALAPTTPCVPCRSAFGRTFCP
jgi:hypothetical protein